MLSNEKAFTLIEVLITVGVVSLGLVWVMHSLRTCLSSVEASREIFKQYLLIENKIWELENGRNIPLGIEEGDIQEEDRSYRWKTEVTEVENISLNKLKLGVYGEKGEKIAHLETYILPEE